MPSPKMYTKPRTDEEALIEICYACKRGRGRSGLRWDVNMKGDLLNGYLDLAMRRGLIEVGTNHQDDVIFTTTVKGCAFIEEYERKF